MTVSLPANPITGMSRPMLLEELFASIRDHRSRWAQQSTDEEGTEITRRLHELLDLERPSEAETSSTEAPVKTTENSRV
jgi:hypothetical protein